MFTTIPTHHLARSEAPAAASNPSDVLRIHLARMRREYVATGFHKTGGGGGGRTRGVSALRHMRPRSSEGLRSTMASTPEVPAWAWSSWLRRAQGVAGGKERTTSRDPPKLARWECPTHAPRASGHECSVSQHVCAVPLAHLRFVMPSQGKGTSSGTTQQQAAQAFSRGQCA